MSIASVNPVVSKAAGGVIIEILGNSFPVIEPLISFNQIDYLSSSDPAHLSWDSLTQEVKLQSPAFSNSLVSIDYITSLPKYFSLELDFKETVHSYPLFPGDKTLGIKLSSIVDSSRKIESCLEFSKTKGYLFVLSSINSLGILERKETPVDHWKIEKIGLEGLGDNIYSFIISNGEKLYLSSVKSFDIDSFSLSFFLQGGLNSHKKEIILSNFTLKRTASFAGYPTEIIEWEENLIKIKTKEGEIKTGDISVASGFSFFELENLVQYAVTGSSNLFKKNYDTIQSVYSQYLENSRSNLFKNRGGFVWDDYFFVSDSHKNTELYIPSFWDPLTGNIPSSFYQSGIGYSDNLLIEKLIKKKINDKETWHPEVFHGSYFIERVPYYLFSDDSIVTYLGTEKNSENRSYINLRFMPKENIPVNIYSMTEDKSSGRILETRKPQKRDKFSGLILNGTELDSTSHSNIDQSKEEFIIIKNNNNKIIDWIIPVTEKLTPGLWTFKLPDIPLIEYPIIFSRKDIFSSQKELAKTYGSDSYSLFQYGSGIENNGDYAIDYERGEVTVLLEYPYTELGTVTYWNDYPARIEFNKDFSKQIGPLSSQVSINNLKDMDRLGESNGRPSQEFRLNSFPIIDNSYNGYLDTSKFRLYLYNQEENSFDSNWTRVKDIKDFGPNAKVYELNSDNGILKFGNGINGTIPSKFLLLYASYLPTLKIEYETEISGDYWSGIGTDFNLIKQNLNNAFLYLTRKELKASRVSLTNMTGAINTNEEVEIRATVFTEDGDVVPQIPVYFELLTDTGQLLEEILISDSNGEAYNSYIPSSKLEDMAIKINLFEEGTSIDIPGNPIPKVYGEMNGVPYRYLNLPESIAVDSFNLDDYYLFKILDDGDGFLPYNNITRKGGRFIALNDGSGVINPASIAERALWFNEELPQPFEVARATYEKNLRGFYLISKKNVQLRAYILVDDSRIYSEIINLVIEYSELQKGVWRLPIPPMDYESTQINTATYIRLD